MGSIAKTSNDSTAVALIPPLAKRAFRVTMLQRSPRYILAQPAVDIFAQ